MPRFIVHRDTVTYLSLEGDNLYRAYKLTLNDDYTFYILAGIGIYAFQEKLRFKFNMAMPITSHFSARFSAQFVLEDAVVPVQ